MPKQISRAAYADMYGPTTGDRLRLADTDLIGEMAGLKCLAHRMPPEDKGFKDKAFAGSVEIDLDPSCKAACLLYTSPSPRDS